MSPEQLKQQQQYNATTKAFLTKSREAALREHPELKPAYAAFDKLSETMSKSQPLTADTSRDVDYLIRNTVARSLVRGEVPDATPKLQEAVKLQVAVRNLNTVEEAHRENPAHAPQLPPGQRELLVKHADVAMTLDPKPTVQRAGAYASSDRFEAYGVSRALARIDHANNLQASPFRDKELARAYSMEHKWMDHLRERGGQEHQSGTRGADRQPQVDRGLER